MSVGERGEILVTILTIHSLDNYILIDLGIGYIYIYIYISNTYTMYVYVYMYMKRECMFN